MKYVTFRSRDGADRLGVWIGDEIVDLREADPTGPFQSLLDLIVAGEEAWGLASAVAANASAKARIAAKDVSLRAPIPEPPQMRDAMSSRTHILQASVGMTRLSAQLNGRPEAIEAAERYAAAPRVQPIHYHQPVYYKANRFSVSGPGDEIAWPAYSEVMDFELELACVIGLGGRDIPASGAMEHVFGFTVFNDFSARDAQAIEVAGGLGPAKGKDFDGANAMGPCLVTADELGDPYDLRMVARVNGEVCCDTSSATFDWRFPDLIAHISKGETLRPGEVIGSGTVAGGCGLELGHFLSAGDVVELEVEKIGVLRNRVVRA